MGIEDYPRQSYSNVFIGYGIRGTIGGDMTYRVRRGNGYYGSELGHIYQDMFTTVIPSSITNVESESYRVLLTEAVAYWKNTLSAEQKKEYNRRASHGLQMSGYNLFIRDYILGIAP